MLASPSEVESENSRKNQHVRLFATPGILHSDEPFSTSAKAWPGTAADAAHPGRPARRTPVAPESDRPLPEESPRRATDSTANTRKRPTANPVRHGICALDRTPRKGCCAVLVSADNSRHGRQEARRGA